MTSGVIRASVRSRFRWRMISWPALKPMRCVNPSMATVSPSRTRSAIASRIVATLPGMGLRSEGGQDRVSVAVEGGLDDREEREVVRRARRQRHVRGGRARPDERQHRLRREHVVQADLGLHRRQREPGVAGVEVAERVDPAGLREPVLDVGPDPAVEPEQEPQPERHRRDPGHVPARHRVEVADQQRVVVGRPARPLQQRVHAPQPRPLAPRGEPGREVEAQQAQPRLPGRVHLEEAARPARPVPLMPPCRLPGERRDAPLGPAVDVWQARDARDPVDARRVDRLLEQHDVGLQGGQHGTDERHPPAAAEPDVVRDEAHRGSGYSGRGRRHGDVQPPPRTT